VKPHRFGGASHLLWLTILLYVLLAQHSFANRGTLKSSLRSTSARRHVRCGSKVPETPPQVQYSLPIRVAADVQPTAVALETHPKNDSTRNGLLRAKPDAELLGYRASRGNFEIP
jgi:hypothetical protein